MSILVTGADGFVGQHMIRYLLDTGEQVVALTHTVEPVFPLLSKEERAALEVCNAVEITNAAALGPIITRFRPQVVFHLAAQSHVPTANSDPHTTFHTNVMGTLALMHELWRARAVPQYDPTVLITSSAQVYGSVPNNSLPIREDEPIHPDNAYAASKAAQEITALSYFYGYSMRVIVTRAFNHIGPGQSLGFVVPAFARQLVEAEEGLRPPLIKVGNLEARRDFTDVRDVVNAYLLLAHLGQAGKVYNICSGEPVSIATILDRLCARARIKINIEVDAARLRPLDIPVLFGDNRQLREITGWQPTYSLDQTLYDVYEEQRAAVASRQSRS
ncbi:MAG: GDP-mannose 4,6-dehydratase [Acidobacteriota bacterium]